MSLSSLVKNLQDNTLTHELSERTKRDDKSTFTFPIDFRSGTRSQRRIENNVRNLEFSVGTFKECLQVSKEDADVLEERAGTGAIGCDSNFAAIGR